KEQLGPAPSAHHLAPPPAEFGDAGQPRRARPALFQERLGGGIMDDAAVAGEHAAVRRGDDLAGRGDAVLQRHSAPSFRDGPKDQTRKPEIPGSRFRAPRNDSITYAAPSRSGGANDSAVSQGKKIQVSCDTSVM